MPPQAERRVPVLFPVQLYRVGVLEDAGVPVGGREREQQPVALLQLVPVEVEVLGHKARHRDRCVGAQELLDGGAHQTRVAGQPAPVGGMPGQVPEGRANRRPGGVDPGDHQQDHGAADVLPAQLAAADLRLDEERGEVVPGVCDVIVDLGVHVRVELAEHRLPLLVLGGHVDLLEHQPDEAPEAVGVFLGEPQEPDDDPDRDVPGVLDGRVEARLTLGLREQFAAQVPGERLEGGGRPGPEGGQQHPPGHGVEGRVRRDRRGQPDRRGQVVGTWPLLADHDRAGGEMLGVVGHLGDQVVGHRQPRPAVPVAVRDRAALAQVLPDRVRVGHPGGVGVIEVGSPVLDRGMAAGHG